MTVQDNRDQLERLLADTMVELPVELQQRLQQIPSRRSRVNWSALFTLFFLTPLVVWGGAQLLPYLIEFLTQLSSNPGNFALTTLFSGGIYSWVPAAVLIGVIFLTLLALRDELIWQ